MSNPSPLDIDAPVRERGTLEQRGKKEAIAPTKLQWDAIVSNLNAMQNPRYINCHGAGWKWGMGGSWPGASRCFLWVKSAFFHPMNRGFRGMMHDIHWTISQMTYWSAQHTAQ